MLIVGVATMTVGGIRGVMCGNLKTTLAYSSMSQIGFILTGVGMQSLLAELLTAFASAGYADSAEVSEIVTVFGMAINGTFLHMLNHSLVKLILFMAAGVIFTHVGSYDLNQVRGFGHRKPFLLVTFVLAAAGVGGIPLLNGYVSKTLLHESIVKYGELISLAAVNGAVMAATPMMIKVSEVLFLFSGGLTVAYMTNFLLCCS